jgi:hypothetical protein
LKHCKFELLALDVSFEADSVGSTVALSDEEFTASAEESKLYREALPKLDALGSKAAESGVDMPPGSNRRVHDTIAVTASPTPRMVTWFFQLDPNTRRQLYFHALRPECRGRNCDLWSHKCEFDFSGCTNVLVPSSQAYQKSIEVLHQYENVVRADASPLGLF